MVLTACDAENNQLDPAMVLWILFLGLSVVVDLAVVVV
jgi:hypothetical protein